MARSMVPRIIEAARTPVTRLRKGPLLIADLPVAVGPGATWSARSAAAGKARPNAACAGRFSARRHGRRRWTGKPRRRRAGRYATSDRAHASTQSGPAAASPKHTTPPSTHGSKAPPGRCRQVPAVPGARRADPTRADQGIRTAQGQGYHRPCAGTASTPGAARGPQGAATRQEPTASSDRLPPMYHATFTNSSSSCWPAAASSCSSGSQKDPGRV